MCTAAYYTITTLIVKKIMPFEYFKEKLFVLLRMNSSIKSYIYILYMHEYVQKHIHSIQLTN